MLWNDIYIFAMLGCFAGSLIARRLHTVSDESSRQDDKLQLFVSIMNESILDGKVQQR